MDAGQSTPLRCVLADDHDSVRATVHSQLSRLEWIDLIDVATDGADAIRAIEQHRPDVALVDVRMSGATGLEVCERVRELELDTRVVLYSGLISDELAARAEEVGAVALVAKQDGFGAIRTELARLCGRT